MANFEQTKGYLNLRGVVYGIDNKEPFESEYKKSLNFRIKTSKENTLFVQAGGWKSSSLNVKLKGEGMEEVVDIPESDVADEIAAFFKDGDSVFLQARADINTYSNRVDYTVSKMYILDKELDFEAEDFEEVNELNIPAIITDLPKDRIQKVLFATYKGETLEQDLEVNDDDVLEFLNENVNVGDLVPFTLRVGNEPIYEIVEVEGDKKEEKPRTTLKGKKVGGSKKGKKKITGNKSFVEIIDIDTEKIVKGKYNAQDLPAKVEEGEDLPF